MLTLCPHCGKHLAIPNYARHNVESYGDPVMVKTLCCDKPVSLGRIITLTVALYEGNQTEDDWGTPL